MSPLTPPMRLASFLLSATLMMPVATHAQTWTFVGLGGKVAYELKIRDGWFFAATNDGVFRKGIASPDTNWTSLGLTGIDVRSLLFLDSQTILAGGTVQVDPELWERRIYQSTNQGLSWTPVLVDSTGADVMDLKVSPVSSDTVFAASYEFLKSTNAGLNWAATFAHRRWNSLRISAFNPSTLWIGGEGIFFNALLFKSLNSGSTWTTLSSPNPLGENAVNAIEIDPVEENRIYLGMESYIFRTDTGGPPWQQVYNDPGFWVWDIEVVPWNRSDLFATGNYQISPDPGWGIRLLTSSDYGATWQTIDFKPLAGEYAGYDIELSAEHGNLYVYLAGTGVYKIGPFAVAGVGDSPQPVSALGAPRLIDSSIAIPFTVGLDGQSVDLSVYDLSGRLVDRLVHAPVPIGDHEAIWKGVDQFGRITAPGIYLVRLAIGEFTAARKMPPLLR